MQPTERAPENAGESPDLAESTAITEHVAAASNGQAAEEGGTVNAADADASDTVSDGIAATESEDAGNGTMIAETSESVAAHESTELAEGTNATEDAITAEQADTSEEDGGNESSSTPIVREPTASENSSTIDQVASALSSYEEIESKNGASLRSACFDVLASVYVLAVVAKEDGTTMDELNKRAGLEGKRGGVSDYQHVLTASLKISNRTLKKSTKGLWTKGVEALAFEKLPANFRAARDWFDVPEDINSNGELLTGTEKAKAICKRQPASGQSAGRAQSREVGKQTRWAKLTQSDKFKDGIGQIKIADSTALQEGEYVFQLGRFGKGKITLLDITITKQETVRRLALAEVKS